MTKQPSLLTLEEKVASKSVKIVCDVKHTKDFFRKHHRFFKGVIAESDAVMLEQPSINFWEEEDFFGPVGEIAYSQNKRVYQADPITFLSYIMDLGVFGVGLHLLVSYLLTPLILRKRKPKQEITRREFLKKLGKKLGIGALGSSLVVGSPVGQGVSEHCLPKKVLTEYGAEDMLTYGNCDYRNIVIAEGIEKVCSCVADLNSLVVIGGYGHTGDVSTYLRNPSLRVKRPLYFPFSLVSNTRTREYTPSQNGWVLTRKL